MARIKKRRYAGGGELEAADEIVVKGKRPRTVEEISQFDLSRIGGLGAGSFGGSDMVGGGGGGMPSQRLPNLSYNAPKADRPAIVPAVVRSERSELSEIMGDKAPRGYGAKFRASFAKGGKADGEPTGGKKHTKAKRYATGGSTASKRADGIARKGKTRGKVC